MMARSEGSPARVLVDGRVPNIYGDPIIVLEHVNLDITGDWGLEHENFFFDILKCGKDSRAPAVLERVLSCKTDCKDCISSVTDLRWANFGYQQLHLPCYADAGGQHAAGQHARTHQCSIYKASFRRGAVVIAWPALDFDENLPRRLKQYGWDFSVDTAGVIKVADPMGNHYHLERTLHENLIGPCKRPLFPDPNKSVLPSFTNRESIGLGLKCIELKVPVGRKSGSETNAVRIGRFYEHIFGLKTWRVRERASVSTGTLRQCEIHMGGVAPHGDNMQVLLFVEEEYTDADERKHAGMPLMGLREPHVAIYVNDFEACYERTKSMGQVKVPGTYLLGEQVKHTVNGSSNSALYAEGLCYVNPQFPQCKYTCLEEAKKMSEFRIKDICDLETHECIFELEHEVRDLFHPAVQYMQPFFSS